MRILFITQTWDEQDSVLGFVPSWVAALRTVFSSTTVIALRASLKEYSHSIPVYSLGKEDGRGYVSKVFRFYQLVWRLRKSYDVIFVHMNPEYIVLAGLLWRLLGKKIVLWSAHGAVPFALHIAGFFAHRILTSTKEGCRLSSPKVRVIGQAIDTTLFTPSLEPASIPTLVVVGRISQTKGQAIAVRALALIHEKYPDTTLEILGAPIYDTDHVYESTVRALTRELGIESQVVWRGPLTRTTLANELPRMTLCINMSTNGSLDKAGLEALAAGVPVITGNPAFRAILSGVADMLFISSGESVDIVRAALSYLALSPNERERIRTALRERVVAEHSITTFAERVLKAL